MLLTDGYPTLITLSNRGNPAIIFREMETEPPEANLGGALDDTTMRNTLMRTAMPKHLISMEEITVQVQWDTRDYLTLIVPTILLGVNQLITITFPDGAQLAIYGWVEGFKPNGHKEGGFAQAALKLHFSHRDAAGNERRPTISAPTKTVYGAVIDPSTVAGQAA